MGQIDELIKYALSQVGTGENPLGSNKQPYGAYIDSTDWYLYKDGNKTWRHLVNGYDWCTQFHDACFLKVFGIEKSREMLGRPQYNNLGAVVKYQVNYMKAINRFGTQPQKGASIYFKNNNGPSHIGIVYDFDKNYVYTVEGNSGNNCWYVAKHKYSIKYDRILGYGYPLYNEQTIPFKAVSILDGISLRDIPYSDGKTLCSVKKDVEVEITEIGGSTGEFGKVTITGWVHLPNSFKF